MGAVVGEPMIRIQRKRTKGWRMPEGAIYVGRPTQWGNPVHYLGSVQAFRRWIERWRENDRTDGTYSLIAWLAPLRDATALACWCGPGQSCHADVLIEMLEQERERSAERRAAR